MAESNSNGCCDRLGVRWDTQTPQQQPSNRTVPRSPGTIKTQPTPLSELRPPSPPSPQSPVPSPPASGPNVHGGYDIEQTNRLMADFGNQHSPPPTGVMTPPPVLVRPTSAYFPEIMPAMTEILDIGGKMAVSIDFGTTFSGVAYGSSRIQSGRVQQILLWPGSSEHFRKVPTCLVYDENGMLLSWGIEAKNEPLVPGRGKCEWFKLFLEPRVLRDSSTIDSRLPQIPFGKMATDLIVDYLMCLWGYAKTEITRQIGAVADLNSADVWLTVPAAWDAKGCELMREAAIKAGLVASSHANDRNWRDRLHIITEPEAAAVHCAYLTDLHKLKPGQSFMICDAGGGTVDLAAYKLLGQMADLEIGEICTRSGANCGSIFLDILFIDLVKDILRNHPTHLDHLSLSSFQYSFSDTDKHAYRGECDDDNTFYFNCFNVGDDNDPSIGLIHGQLAIPGWLLRINVFEPVVNQVLDLIDKQLGKVEQGVDALLLVGGFAGSEYLFHRVDDQFGQRIPFIGRPPDTDTATLRGAAQYGLSRRPLVSSIIASRSYLVKVKLPVEPEDRMQRPAYIKKNAAGIESCDNRLFYLLEKGAVLRRNQRITARFCKYSQSHEDSVFVAMLYTSDTDRTLRYVDDGDIMELCKWTVDIAHLPTFLQNPNKTNSKGFYTEFELGLELDSAEVRGVLLYQGEALGTVVFDFLA